MLHTLTLDNHALEIASAVIRFLWPRVSSRCQIWLLARAIMENAKDYPLQQALSHYNP